MFTFLTRVRAMLTPTPVEPGDVPAIPSPEIVSYPNKFGVGAYHPMLAYVAAQVMNGRGSIGYIPGQGIVYHLPLTAYDRERYTFQDLTDVWIVMDMKEDI
jgi:hypothetical protein